PGPYLLGPIITMAGRRRTEVAWAREVRWPSLPARGSGLRYLSPNTVPAHNRSLARSEKHDLRRSSVLSVAGGHARLSRLSRITLPKSEGPASGVSHGHLRWWVLLVRRGGFREA